MVDTHWFPYRKMTPRPLQPPIFPARYARGGALRAEGTAHVSSLTTIPAQYSTYYYLLTYSAGSLAGAFGPSAGQPSTPGTYGRLACTSLANRGSMSVVLGDRNSLLVHAT